MGDSICAGLVQFREFGSVRTYQMKQSWKRISLISLLALGALGLSVLIVACGGHSSSNSVVYPKPAIASLFPSSVPTGSASGALTINGTGFLTLSTVTFNGVAHAATYMNASQLTIRLTAADLAAAGKYPVVVSNPAPGGGASAAVNFDVISNNPIPAITTLSPAFLVVDAAPQTLTIDGTGFLTSSTVTFNGVVHAATYVSATQLTISLTAADLATDGNYPVVVANPAPGGGKAPATTFSVWGELSDKAGGFSVSFPPSVYNVSALNNSTNSSDLASYPNGVAIGDAVPDAGASNEATSGFDINIYYQPYKITGAFDVNSYVSTTYPGRLIGSDTPVNVGGQQAFELTFGQEEGGGHPDVIVYRNGVVYEISYASTINVAGYSDTQGLSVFNQVIQNFIFSK